MWSAEWRKILIKQKGLLVIAVMLLIKIVFALRQEYDSNWIIDRNPEGYASYISQYEGKLTTAKEEQLQAEYNSVTHATGKLEELSRQWQEGTIDQESYEENSKAYYERIKNSAVFQVLYNQYFYAKDAPEERYIMDQRGWSTLLSHGTPDLILLLCLLVIITPLFCYEYESGMNVLLRSSSKGKYLTGVVKLTVGCVLAVSVTILFAIVKWICLDQRIGMQHGAFPLQSITFFADSEYHVSLNGAFLIMLLCQIMGALLLTSCISLIGIISQKSIITLFVGSVLVFLPYILFKGSSILYILPLPPGLLEGTGYLWGTTYVNTYNEQGNMEKLVQFQAIDRKLFLLLLLVYTLEIGFMLLYALKKYSGFSIRIHRLQTRLPKLLILFCLPVISSAILTGCQVQDTVQDLTYDARVGRDYGEAAEYAISLDETTSMITAKSLKSGEQLTLTREPFAQERLISAIFVLEDWCYYVTQTLGIEGIQIYGIDMNNFSQTQIYNSVRENSEDFFGVAAGQEDIETILKNNTRIYCFFLNEDKIYYVAGADLVEIDRKTNGETVVARNVKTGLSLVYHNGDIFYIDQQYRLNRYRSQEGQLNTIDSIYTDDFKIEGNTLSYSALLDNNQIHSYLIEE